MLNLRSGELGIVNQEDKMESNKLQFKGQKADLYVAVATILIGKAWASMDCWFFLVPFFA